jgi:hypothetical protein
MEEPKEASLIQFTAPKEKPDDIKIGPAPRGVVPQQLLFKATAPKTSAINWVTRANGPVPGHIAMDPY